MDRSLASLEGALLHRIESAVWRTFFASPARAAVTSASLACMIHPLNSSAFYVAFIGVTVMYLWLKLYSPTFVCLAELRGYLDKLRVLYVSDNTSIFWKYALEKMQVEKFPKDKAWLKFIMLLISQLFLDLIYQCKELDRAEDKKRLQEVAEVLQKLLGQMSPSEKISKWLTITEVAASRHDELLTYLGEPLPDVAKAMDLLDLVSSLESG